MIADSWDKWWANTGEGWLKKMLGPEPSLKDVAATAFGAGHAAGESAKEVGIGAGADVAATTSRRGPD